MGQSQRWFSWRDGSVVGRGGHGHKGLRHLVACERGDTIMLEAIIVWPSVTMLAILILGLYSYMYQSWNLNILANDAAARIGLMFRYYSSAESIITGEISPDDLEKSDPYRYYDPGTPKIKRGELTDAVRNMAEEYLASRTTGLMRTTEVGVRRSVKVNVSIEDNKMARNHIVVSIEAEYNIPFMFAIWWFMGADDPSRDTMTAVGYADCLDLSDYIVITGYASSMSDKVSALRDELTSLGVGNVDIEVRKIGERAEKVLGLMQKSYVPS